MNRIVKSLLRPEGDSSETRDFSGFEMVVQNLRQACGIFTSKSAKSGKTELGKKSARSRQPLRKAVHIVNHPQVDLRTGRFQIGQGREKRLLAGVEHRKMQPVHPAAGVCRKGVRQRNGAAQIIGGKSRPAAQGPETKMKPKSGMFGDNRAQLPELRNIPFDHGSGLGSVESTIGIHEFRRAVPLNGEIPGRNMFDDYLQFGLYRIEIARPYLVEISRFPETRAVR